MNKWIKLLMVVGVVTLAVSAIMATEPPNLLPRQPLRTASNYMYKPLVGAGATASTTTWALDSAGVDTSEAYLIVPGCYVNVSLKLDAAADTVTGLRVYGAQTSNTADWIVIDSLLNITSVTKSRNLIGTASATPILTAGAPVMFRYIWFVATNDDGAAAATTVTGYVTSTPAP